MPDVLSPFSPEFNLEMEQTLLTFETIQQELNYQQAQKSLREVLRSCDLAPREQQGLEKDLDDLVILLEKLDRSCLHIAAFGLVGRGKSSVLNALLGRQHFEAGPVHGVTQTLSSSPWHWPTSAGDLTINTLTLSGWGQGQVHLLDTPGLDEVNGQERAQLAQQVAQKVDLILFVVAGDISQVEHQALSQLRRVGKPMLLVFNKIDQYPPGDRQLIYEKIRDQRVKELLSADEIVLVAASPLLTKVVSTEAGALQRCQYRGEPQIEELRLKIFELLQREGKSLLALNTLLWADTVNERLVERKLKVRDTLAEQLIQKAMLTKAIAIALNPVTALDLFSGAIIDVALILSLARLYGLTMTQNTAIALLRQIAFSMGGISASEFLASLGLSSLKGLLGLTVPVSAGLSLGPYTAIALTQGSVAGVSSYAIGQVTKTYLAQGAAWGPLGPKQVVTEILASLDQKSILHRLREELREKVRPQIARPTHPGSRQQN